ncbi:MAG: neutral zinc metallopeptidase [Pseudomonadota bacterium]
MRWDNRRRSDNVEFRKGAAGAGMTGAAFLLVRFIFSRFGIGGVVVAVGALFVAQQMGLNPLGLITGGGGGSVSREATTQEQDFVTAIVGSTEDVWTRLFAQRGSRYVPPAVVVFEKNTNSGCGPATAASGPFYCPADRKIYFDLAFFDELARRFGAPGDFAQAYVIAHEVGHHIQTITGTSRQVREAQSRTNKVNQNALQVQMELQADCYAGVWAFHADRSAKYGNILQEGDVEEALNAATAIGDDTLQRQAGRRVNQESFTHGSAQQRVRWFRTGLQTGNVESCETFQRGSR